MTRAMASENARALDDVVAAVAQARPRLVDPLEAGALIGSPGYTDARMRRGFRFCRHPRIRSIRVRAAVASPDSAAEARSGRHHSGSARDVPPVSWREPRL